ncbi:GGDEF domain-containing protein [Thalassotalea agariperforans]
MRSEIITTNSHVQNKQFKALILGRIMIISVIFTLFFAILDTLKINYIGDVQRINNYLHAAFVLPAYFLFKHRKMSLTCASHYFLLFCFITSITALLFADNDAFRAIWFFLSTMISFIFVGKKYGNLYGYCSFVFIAVAGFYFESNLNAESILSILISFLVLILVMSAYTGQMEKHLDHIEQIQQELYYLANKSDISNSLSSNEHALTVEQMLKNAQELNSDFSLIYVDIENFDELKSHFDNYFIVDIKNKLNHILKALVSSSDIVSTINNDLLYIAVPNRDCVSIKHLVEKIYHYIRDHGLQVNGQQIELKLCISVTTLQKNDTGIRALHIRADKGLMKAKAMGGEQIVFVDM